jgi:lysophospholipase L1-like esterase
MKRLIATLLSATLAGLLPLQAQSPNPAPTAPIAVSSYQKPDMPAPKLTNGEPDAKFIQAHEGFVKIAAENKSGVMFLGDSITAGWKRAPAVWSAAFGAYQPANFGIKGDRTQHVLWRITNGELDGFTPKAIVLLIGTNNIGSRPENIAGGITKIVETIHQKTPATKILLLAILPRGEKPGPMRDSIKQVNTLIAKLDDGKSVFYLDFGDKLLEPDGTISKEVMWDFLHPTPKGYQICADAIAPKLAELMK